MSSTSEIKVTNAQKINFNRGNLSHKDSLDRSGGMNFYQIRLGNRSRFTCDLTRQPGDFDLTLLDRDGQVVVGRDEDGENIESIRRTLSAGVYYIGVTDFGETKEYSPRSTNYTLESSVVAIKGTTIKKALKISTKQMKQGKVKFTGNIGGTESGQFSYCQFKVGQPSSFSGQLKGLTALVKYEILDSKGKKIAISSGGNTSRETVNKLLAAGTYFIKIGTASSVETTYNFNLNFGQPEVVQFTPSTITTGTSVFTKQIQALTADSYYKVDLTSASNLNFLAGGLSADVNLQLLSSTGSVLYSSTNVQTTEEQINFNLEAGSYFVRVFPGTSNVSANCSLSFTTAPVQAGSLTNSVTLSNGYRITYLGTDNLGSTSTWRYYMEELPVAQDLSNWVLGLPSGSQVVQASPKGELVNPDPNANISGIKWQPGDGFVEGNFSVTLSGTPQLGTINVAAKGPDVVVGQLLGPV